MLITDDFLRQMNQSAIVKLLDECLLSDEEMASYRQHWGLDEAKA